MICFELFRRFLLSGRAGDDGIPETERFLC